ncbi:hypothetical protein [Variovorax sp. KK3]|uniref:hypothetical protein n=1 Tax=Variovorax sp. KK3 TaxID=1855728 RepID=UPI00097C1EB0|nr:hypothetical protein [Variovorax sp. KK3]
MNKKSMNVDYGAMSLHVGEDSVGSNQGPGPNEHSDEAIRAFRSGLAPRPDLMSGDGERHSRPASPFDLLAFGEHGARPGMHELGEEIARLYVADVRRGDREVRAAVSARLLPQTGLRIFEDGGRLQVQLAIGCEDTRRWLAERLASLGQHLGTRLQRSVCVSLHEVDFDTQPLLRALWPEDAAP